MNLLICLFKLSTQTILTQPTNQPASQSTNHPPTHSKTLKLFFHLFKKIDAHVSKLHLHVSSVYTVSHVQLSHTHTHPSDVTFFPRRSSLLFFPKNGFSAILSTSLGWKWIAKKALSWLNIGLSSIVFDINRKLKVLVKTVYVIFVKFFDSWIFV